VAFAPDEPVHAEALSGHENAAFFHAFRGVAPAPGVDPWVEAFGLAAEAHRRVGTWSFGMRRKLLLAQVFGAGAALLLLDEPSVGLDPEGVAALRKGLDRAAAHGRTVVVATNEVEHLPFWVDRCLVLHQGRVVVEGPAAALVASLEAATVIHLAGEELRLPPGLEALGGIVRVEAPEPGRLTVWSEAGTAPLPSLLARLLDAGHQVTDVRVRTPGMAEVFRRHTGAALGADGPG
jgi:ABC-2 type transport system ATP-binding protein